MAGPFAGLTVVEVSQFVVAPFCGQLLADGGARVIKVEPPEGDAYRRNQNIAPRESRHYLVKNRGKESVALDLGREAGDAALRRLLDRADVVLLNMAPATVARRRLTYDDLAATNPGVIYGVVSAFGHRGPEAHLPGMDVVVQARSGLLAALGAERDGVPYHSEVQVADYSASLLLLAGISTALYARAVTGRGQKVEVSLLGGALAIQNNELAHVYEHDGWRERFVAETLPQLRARGATLAEIDRVRREARPDPPRHTALYRVFRTADGMVAIGAGSPPARARLLALAGIDGAEGDHLGDDLGQRVDEVVRQRPTAHWVEALREAHVPVAEVRQVDELLLDTHCEAEGLVADFEHPVVGRYRGLGTPIRLSATPFAAERPSPRFAAHTASVLGELGYSDDEIAALAAEGAVVMEEDHPCSSDPPR